MPKRRANGEGTITQRKDKTGKKLDLWQAQYTDNTGKRRTLYGKTQQIVRQRLKEAIKESDDGMQVDKGKITFADWMKEWLEVYQKPTVRESTYAMVYGVMHRHVIPAFPKVLLKDLRADMLQNYFNSKLKTDKLNTKGLSASTLYRHKEIISSLLNQAVDNGIISQNVIGKVKLPPKSEGDVKVLSVDDQKRLEAVLLKASNPLAFALLLDLYTGLRVGELTGLKVSDIDFEREELTICRSKGRLSIPATNKTKILISEPKTPKSRRAIPIPSFIMARLKRHIDDRNKMVDVMKDRWHSEWEDKGFLFVTILGTVPENSYMGMLLDAYLKEAGIEHIKFHALRHTFATRCLEAGFDIRSLADILGHSDARMTLNIYAHALPDQKRNNMERLTDLFNLDNPEK